MTTAAMPRDVRLILCLLNLALTIVLVYMNWRGVW